jgi:GNAT superfamily N-acetyltransferase
MAIERIGADDPAAMAEWFVPIDAAARAEWDDGSDWSLQELTVLATDDTRSRSVVAVERDGLGEVRGSMWIRMPLQDNRHVADLTLAVHPRHVRRGVGTALVRFAEDEALAAGRTNVVAVHDYPIERPGPPPSRPFAEQLGYEMALGEARRTLQLPADPALLDVLESACAPHAVDYTIVTWTGPCPDQYAEGRLALARAISTDAPMGALEREEEAWDIERLRRSEAVTEAMGRDAFVAGAVHTPTGALVGVTDIHVPRAKPGTVFQSDTTVLPSHRGHRLGTLVKVANLRHLAGGSSATRRIITWNALDNGPMIRVNDAMGFEVVGLGSVWQKDLG